MIDIYFDLNTHWTAFSDVSTNTYYNFKMWENAIR